MMGGLLRLELGEDAGGKHVETLPPKEAGTS